MVLRRYAESVPLAFPHNEWIAAGDRKTKLERGGFGRPWPPLFPHADGRHRQRAFRDAQADLLPLVHGWLPTLRIADFEAKAWVLNDDAPRRIADLLTARLISMQ